MIAVSELRHVFKCSPGDEALLTARDISKVLRTLQADVVFVKFLAVGSDSVCAVGNLHRKNFPSRTKL